MDSQSGNGFLGSLNDEQLRLALLHYVERNGEQSVLDLMENVIRDNPVAPRESASVHGPASPVGGTTCSDLTTSSESASPEPECPSSMTPSDCESSVEVASPDPEARTPQDDDPSSPSVLLNQDEEPYGAMGSDDQEISADICMCQECDQPRKRKKKKLEKDESLKNGSLKKKKKKKKTKGPWVLMDRLSERELKKYGIRSSSHGEEEQEVSPSVEEREEEIPVISLPDKLAKETDKLPGESSRCVGCSDQIPKQEEWKSSHTLSPPRGGSSPNASLRKKSRRLSPLKSSSEISKENRPPSLVVNLSRLPLGGSSSVKQGETSLQTEDGRLEGEKQRETSVDRKKKEAEERKSGSENNRPILQDKVGPVLGEVRESREAETVPRINEMTERRDLHRKKSREEVAEESSGKGELVKEKKAKSKPGPKSSKRQDSVTDSSERTSEMDGKLPESGPAFSEKESKRRKSASSDGKNSASATNEKATKQGISVSSITKDKVNAVTKEKKSNGAAKKSSSSLKVKDSEASQKGSKDGRREVKDASRKEAKDYETGQREGKDSEVNRKEDSETDRSEVRDPEVSCRGTKDSEASRKNVKGPLPKIIVRVTGDKPGPASRKVNRETISASTSKQREESNLEGDSHTSKQSQPDKHFVAKVQKGKSTLVEKPILARILPIPASKKKSADLNKNTLKQSNNSVDVGLFKQEPPKHIKIKKKSEIASEGSIREAEYLSSVMDQKGDHVILAQQDKTDSATRTQANKRETFTSNLQLVDLKEKDGGSVTSAAESVHSNETEKGVSHAEASDGASSKVAALDTQFRRNVSHVSDDGTNSKMSEINAKSKRKLKDREILRNPTVNLGDSATEGFRETGIYRSNVEPDEEETSHLEGMNVFHPEETQEGRRVNDKNAFDGGVNLRPPKSKLNANPDSLKRRLFSDKGQDSYTDVEHSKKLKTPRDWDSLTQISHGSVSTRSSNKDDEIFTGSSTSSSTRRPSVAASSSNSMPPQPASLRSSMPPPTASSSSSSMPPPTASSSSSSMPPPTASSSSSSMPPPTASSSSSSMPPPTASSSSSLMPPPTASSSSSSMPPPTASSSSSSMPPPTASSSSSSMPPPDSRFKIPKAVASSESASNSSRNQGHGSGCSTSNHFLRQMVTEKTQDYYRHGFQNPIEDLDYEDDTGDDSDVLSLRPDREIISFLKEFDEVDTGNEVYNRGEVRKGDTPDISSDEESEARCFSPLLQRLDDMDEDCEMPVECEPADNESSYSEESEDDEEDDAVEGDDAVGVEQSHSQGEMVDESRMVEGDGEEGGERRAETEMVHSGAEFVESSDRAMMRASQSDAGTTNKRTRTTSNGETIGSSEPPVKRMCTPSPVKVPQAQTPSEESDLGATWKSVFTSYHTSATRQTSGEQAASRSCVTLKQGTEGVEVGGSRFGVPTPQRSVTKSTPNQTLQAGRSLDPESRVSTNVSSPRRVLSFEQHPKGCDGDRAVRSSELGVLSTRSPPIITKVVVNKSYIDNYNSKVQSANSSDPRNEESQSCVSTGTGYYKKNALESTTQRPTENPDRSGPPPIAGPKPSTYTSLQTVNRIVPLPQVDSDHSSIMRRENLIHSAPMPPDVPNRKKITSLKELNRRMPLPAGSSRSPTPVSPEDSDPERSKHSAPLRPERYNHSAPMPPERSYHPAPIPPERSYHSAPIPPERSYHSAPMPPERSYHSERNTLEDNDRFAVVPFGYQHPTPDVLRNRIVTPPLNQEDCVRDDSTIKDHPILQRYCLDSLKYGKNGYRCDCGRGEYHLLKPLETEMKRRGFKEKDCDVVWDLFLWSLGYDDWFSKEFKGFIEFFARCSKDTKKEYLLRIAKELWKRNRLDSSDQHLWNEWLTTICRDRFLLPSLAFDEVLRYAIPDICIGYKPMDAQIVREPLKREHRGKMHFKEESFAHPNSRKLCRLYDIFTRKSNCNKWLLVKDAARYVDLPMEVVRSIVVEFVMCSSHPDFFNNMHRFVQFVKWLVRCWNVAMLPPADITNLKILLHKAGAQGLALVNQLDRKLAVQDPGPSGGRTGASSSNQPVDRRILPANRSQSTSPQLSPPATFQLVSVQSSNNCAAQGPFSAQGRSALPQTSVGVPPGSADKNLPRRWSRGSDGDIERPLLPQPLIRPSSSCTSEVDRHRASQERCFSSNNDKEMSAQERLVSCLARVDDNRAPEWRFMTTEERPFPTQESLMSMRQPQSSAFCDNNERQFNDQERGISHKESSHVERPASVQKRMVSPQKSLMAANAAVDRKGENQSGEEEKNNMEKIEEAVAENPTARKEPKRKLIQKHGGKIKQNLRWLDVDIAGLVKNNKFGVLASKIISLPKSREVEEKILQSLTNGISDHGNSLEVAKGLMMAFSGKEMGNGTPLLHHPPVLKVMKKLFAWNFIDQLVNEKMREEAWNIYCSAQEKNIDIIPELTEVAEWNKQQVFVAVFELYVLYCRAKADRFIIENLQILYEEPFTDEEINSVLLRLKELFLDYLVVDSSLKVLKRFQSDSSSKPERKISTLLWNELNVYVNLFILMLLKQGENSQAFNLYVWATQKNVDLNQNTIRSLMIALSDRSARLRLVSTEKEYIAARVEIPNNRHDFVFKDYWTEVEIQICFEHYLHRFIEKTDEVPSYGISLRRDPDAIVPEPNNEEREYSSDSIRMTCDEIYDRVLTVLKTKFNPPLDGKMIGSAIFVSKELIGKYKRVNRLGKASSQSQRLQNRPAERSLPPQRGFQPNDTTVNSWPGSSKAPRPHPSTHPPSTAAGPSYSRFGDSFVPSRDSRPGDAGPQEFPRRMQTYTNVPLESGQQDRNESSGRFLRSNSFNSSFSRGSGPAVSTGSSDMLERYAHPVNNVYEAEHNMMPGEGSQSYELNPRRSTSRNWHLDDRNTLGLYSVFGRMDNFANPSRHRSGRLTGRVQQNSFDGRYGYDDRWTDHRSGPLHRRLR